MPKHGISKLITTGLREHPAVRAWERLRPERVEPERIEILKGRRDTALRSVYRLAGVGPAGTPVIAKQYRQDEAIPERPLYEAVLPHLPLATPRYYGCVKDLDGSDRWLFLEDVGAERYYPTREEHARQAGRWLGLLHTAGARVGPAGWLPDLRPSHYLRQLRSARERIETSLDNPALTAEDRAIVRTILARCSDLDTRWDRVAAVCAGMPETLVHGDFVAKNIRVRTVETNTTLVVFDWENAGWGIPAADLGHYAVPSRGFTANPHPAAYWAVVREHWPGVTFEAVQNWTTVGTLFRTLVSFDWDVLGLASTSTEEPMMAMRFYLGALAQAVRDLGWGD